MMASQFKCLRHNLGAEMAHYHTGGTSYNVGLRTFSDETPRRKNGHFEIFEKSIIFASLCHLL